MKKRFAKVNRANDAAHAQRKPARSNSTIAQADTCSALVALLRKLPPTGPFGVEGLVASLVADAYRLVSRLEDSGWQQGRDGCLFDPKTGESAGIEFEVKKYGKRPPGRRMLFGHIIEVRRNRPQTELWVLVSTTSFPAALVEDLNDEAFRNNLDILILDCASNGVSTLEVLAASKMELTLSWVARVEPDARQTWADALADVRALPAYTIQAADVEEMLVSRYAFSKALERAQAWLHEHVNSRRKRIEGLNQALGRVGRAPEVSRPLNKQIWSAWIAQPRPEGQLLALTGSEGDGKTWTAIDILRFSADRIPLIVTSNMLDDGGASSLIARALARQCGGDADRWRARLEAPRGLRRAGFRILLLIDGLNEAPRRHIAELLNELLSDNRWNRAIDTIVTSRTPFWTEKILPSLELLPDQLCMLEIGPFDEDREWPVARDHLGAAVGDLPLSVTDALRNPRLWSFAYDLRDRLGGLTEVTLERLLVEHWRMRLAERGDLAVDPEAFNMLIGRSVDLVRSRGGNGVLEPGQLKTLLRDMIDDGGDADTVFAEIRDGVFFRPTLDKRLALRAERVPVALGMLLCERLVAAAERSRPAQAVWLEASAFLDDLPESDQVELIVRTAIFSILALSGDRRHLLPTLLRLWVGLQNMDDDFYRALAIVAGSAPADLVHAIEDEASEDRATETELVAPVSRELAGALQERRNLPKVREAMIDAAKRWFRSFSRQHFGALIDHRANGLIASDILWVHSLDDFAAPFLTSVPVEHWGTSLAYWARRRLVLDKAVPDIYHNDNSLHWLGLADGVTDADIEEALHGARDDDGFQPSQEETAIVADLLEGRILHARAQGYSPELSALPWREGEDEIDAFLSAVASGKPSASAVRFRDFYPDEEDALEAWLARERLIIERAPHLLPQLVQDLLRQAKRVVKDGRQGGFSGFVRDHALLLGVDVIPLIKNYAGRASINDGSSVRTAARAVPAAFVGTATEQHLQCLRAIQQAGPLSGFLDLEGFEPTLSQADLKALTLDALRGDQSATWALLCTLFKGTVRPDPDIYDFLTAMALEDGLFAHLSMHILASTDDDHCARQISGRLPDAIRHTASVSASALIIKGAQDKNYAALRHRVTVTKLAAAAAEDGSAEAAEMLARDFDAILVSFVGKSWTVGRPSQDLSPFDRGSGSGAENHPERFERAELFFSLSETKLLLDTVERHQPSYRAHLKQRVEGGSGSALATIDGATSLVSLLAAESDPDTAVHWIRKMTASGAHRRLHKRLMFGRRDLYAFSRDDPSTLAFREELADLAWHDEAMLDLICLAELEGRDAWLETWIERESRHDVRVHRARAILLRGWRASPTDMDILARCPSTGDYWTFLHQVAIGRAERRLRMRSNMLRYQQAETDQEAWFAYRSLLHDADRRVHIEEQRLGWPICLSRSRANNHELAKSNFVTLFKLIEGELGSSFGSMDVPWHIAPWENIEIYGSVQDRASSE